jgi:tetratricopeptide (TPR) repeat protein
VTHTTTENPLPDAGAAAGPETAAVVDVLLGRVPSGAEPAAGEVAESGTPEPALEVQVAQVAAEVDASLAQSYCRTLVAHLAENSQSVRELEALLVLGLAHPRVLAMHDIPLVQEGRRLAHFLEQEGKTDRAQSLLEMIATRTPGDRQLDHDLASIMRRTGNADRLVDRYMRRAEDCVAGDRTQEAISWLQEILLVDRSRRDVARMIRDLRWGDEEKRRRWRSRVRGALVLVLVAALAVAAVQRERVAADRFAELPPVVSGDLASLKRRVANLAQFENEHPLSIKLWPASRERATLKAEIAQLEARSAQIQIARRTEREAQLAIAESARKQGRIYTQQNRFADALEQFERALALGPADWDQRGQIEIDVDAIRQWIAEHGTRAPGTTR